MDDTSPPVPRPGDFQLAPQQAPPPRPRRTGMWIGVGLGVLLIVLCLGAGVAFVGFGAYMGIRGLPDRYTTALRPDQVVPAETTKIGVSGDEPGVDCQEDPRSDAFQHQCNWAGDPLASGQVSTLWVMITVFPTEKQRMVSGTVAAATEAGLDVHYLKDYRKIAGIGDVAYAGWSESPWEARVIFVKGNATVIVDYGLDPALNGSKPADWSANAEKAARQIAAAM